MFHPFKRLDSAWKAHTPVYLHNGTKENLIWQLKLTGVVILCLWGWSAYEDYQEKRKLNRNTTSR